MPAVIRLSRAGNGCTLSRTLLHPASANPLPFFPVPTRFTRGWQANLSAVLPPS